MKRHTGAFLLAIASLLGALLVDATPAAAAVGTGTVRTSGGPLNVRSAPTTTGRLTGTVPNGGLVALTCVVSGQLISGTVRTTRTWDRLTTNGYISDAYVLRTVSLPTCPTVTTFVEPATTTGPWMLPVAAGIVSGYRTPERPTHDGVDLGALRNTPIHAAAAGTVITVVCNVSAGTCDSDGSTSLRGCGWYAEIEHEGGIVTRYCHMVRQPSVTVGQVVAKGQIIGYVGTSGSSSGPHLHFEVHWGAPATRLNAVNPVPFMRQRGLYFGA